MKIGLTGGIASGKSNVSQILHDFGALTIDADKLAHKLMKPKQELWYQISKCFGREILLENNKIDRKKLGNIIFNDSEKKKKLDQITHPVIIKKIKEKMDKLDTGNNIIVVEVPLLFETGMEDLFREVWVVYTKREIQIKRLKERDDLNHEEAVARIDSQMSLDKKKELADRIIVNNGTKQELKEEVLALWQKVN